MESAASGIIAGINAARYVLGENALVLPKFTMIGALLDYITDSTVENFQPMGANFGILPPLEEKIKDKRERYMALAERSLNWFNKSTYGSTIRCRYIKKGSKIISSNWEMELLGK